MSAREYLEKANRYQVKPEELFQYFAKDVLQITVLYQKSSVGKKPLLARSNRPGSKYIVAFTDQEAAKMVRVQQPEFLEMTEEPALQFLLKAYRSNAEGMMFNPGLDSRFFVVRHQLLDWIRCYCINKFSKQSTAWVIKNGSSVLKGSYQPGYSTIVVYTGEEEASKSAEKSGGEATPISWEDIFRYLERLGSNTLYVNYGLPEAFLLNPEQVNQIKNGSKEGYVEQTSNSYSFIPDISDSDLPKSMVEDESVASLPMETPVVVEEQAQQLQEEEIGDWESAFQEEEPLTLGTDKKLSDTYVPISPIEKPKTETKPKEVEIAVQNNAKVEEKPILEEEKPVPEEEKQTEIIEPKPEIIEPETIEPKSEIIVSEPKTIKPKTEFVESKPETGEQTEQQSKNPTVLENKTPPQQAKHIPEQTKEKTKQKEGTQNTYSAFDNPWDDDDEGFPEPIPHTSLFFQSNNNEKEAEQIQPLKESKPEPKQQKTMHKPEPVQHQQTIPLEPITEKSEEQESAHQQLFNPDIPEDVQYGLRVLETATNEGQGMANGWEVCRALADLRRIWVIVDMEGKMVILASQNETQIADFFTSQQNAQTLIDEAHGRNKSLPPMVPRLISTKKLFRALAPTGCVIWINRGSSNAWTSIMGDTLPYVLQLMAQK